MGGMGAQVPLGVNDWIRIGALVGVQPEGGDNWLIGMIRRFNRGEGRGAVGIQTIGKAPRAVVADSSGLQTEVLLLDLPPLPQPGATQQLVAAAVTVDVVLASLAYEAGVAMNIEVDRRALILRPLSLLERGPDFSIVRFQIEIIC